MRDERKMVPLFVPLLPSVKVLEKEPESEARSVSHLKGLNIVLLVRLILLNPVLLTVPSRLK